LSGSFGAQKKQLNTRRKSETRLTHQLSAMFGVMDPTKIEELLHSSTQFPVVSVPLRLSETTTVRSTYLYEKLNLSASTEQNAIHSQKKNMLKNFKKTKQLTFFNPFRFRCFTFNWKCTSANAEHKKNDKSYHINKQHLFSFCWAFNCAVQIFSVNLILFHFLHFPFSWFYCCFSHGQL